MLWNSKTLDESELIAKYKIDFWCNTIWIVQQNKEITPAFCGVEGIVTMDTTNAFCIVSEKGKEVLDHSMPICTNIDTECHSFKNKTSASPR